MRVKYTNHGWPKIQYVEFISYETEYRVYKTNMEVTVDGIKRSLPYSDPLDGMTIQISADKSQVTVSSYYGFGLIFLSNGDLWIFMNSIYVNSLCGLCGTGLAWNKVDRNGVDMYEVDREGNLIQGLSPDRFIKWTDSWRVADDDPGANRQRF